MNFLQKLICFFLSTSLVIVQSGCYSTRVTHIDQEAVRSSASQKLLPLKKGQRVQITYTDSTNVKIIKGILASVNADKVEVVYNIPGMYRKEKIRILRHQIRRIEISDRKLKKADTVFATVIPIVLIIGFIAYGIGLSKALEE